MKKILLLFFCFFVLISALLRLDFVKLAIKEEVIAKIYEETGLELEIETLNLSPFLELSLNNITVKDAAKIDQLKMNFNLMTLLERRLHLHSLIVQGCKITEIPTLKKNEKAPQLQIDLLELDDFTFKGNGPVDFKGNLTIDDSVKSSFFVIFHKDDALTFNGDLNFAKNEGTLRIKDFMNLEFSVAANAVHANRLHIQYRSISLDGTVKLQLDTLETETELFLTTKEQIQGKILILGSIFTPQIEVNIEGEHFVYEDFQLDRLKGNFSTRSTPKGVAGEYMLSFDKEGIPYRFSGIITGENKESWLPIHFHLRTELGSLADVLDLEFTELEGSLFTELIVSKSGISVKAHLENGLIHNKEYGTTIQSVAGKIESDLENITLSEISATDASKGLLTGSGKIQLKKTLPYTFKLFTENATLVNQENLKVKLSSDLTIEGNLDGATIQGKVTTKSIKFDIPDKLPSKIDTIPITYINVEEYDFAPSLPKVDTKWPLKLDISVDIPEDLKIRGDNLKSEWKGEVAIKGTLDQPKYKGELKLKEGQFDFRGKKLEFKEGLITFALDKISLYLLAEMELDKATVQAVLKGPIDDPLITLRSNPPMSQRSILSLILFGKEITDISPMEKTQATRSLRSLTEQSQGGPDLLSKMGNVFGLDQVEIGQPTGGTSGDFTVRVGKYLSKGTCLTVSQTISRDADQRDNASVGIETKISRWLRVRAEADTDSNGRLNLIWRRDY